MNVFILSIVAWSTTLAVVGFIRGRRAVAFVGVLLGIYTLIALTLSRWVGPLLPIYLYLQFAVYLNFILLAQQSMRSFAFRVLLVWPASWFLASTMTAFPWALAEGFGFQPRFLWIPYGVALLGFVDTFRTKLETVPVVVRRRDVQSGQENALVRANRMQGHDLRPLRIMQITDPHLGSFMSVDRLEEICERVVDQNPDLVLLTGDFLTVESNQNSTLLGKALAPLKKLPGRCFACFGNHDHEAPEHVRAGLASAGTELLVDEMICVETVVGPVEILGFDFHWENRKGNLERVSARYPRNQALRIGLLHHPGHFEDLPQGTADLVLSGHTHGGQLGLLWFGLRHTIVSALTKIPDHGLWSRGQDLLYVHRGTGHYGFPLRLGVPPEQSVLELHRL